MSLPASGIGPKFPVFFFPVLAAHPRTHGSVCTSERPPLLSSPSISERVRLLEDVRYEQAPQVHRENDIFVFRSLAQSYGHPLVEAMACGLPVVAAWRMRAKFVGMRLSTSICSLPATLLDRFHEWLTTRN